MDLSMIAELVKKVSGDNSTANALAAWNTNKFADLSAANNASVQDSLGQMAEPGDAMNTMFGSSRKKKNGLLSSQLGLDV